MRKSSKMITQAYLGRRRERPLTCLGDVGELEVGKGSNFDRAMPASYPTRRLPRKWWEWDYIAECAEKLGLMHEKATVLGLGVGDEPLIFYFAKYCGRVIATDLYSSDTAWKEARFEDVARVYDAAPFAFPRERLEVRNADMRSTGVSAGTVDFIWSCSSIEHIPTLRDLMLVFQEIHRTLKVGGHAILTTEFCITGNTYLLPGVNAWTEEIFAEIQKCLPGFRFLGETDFTYNALHPGNGARPRRYLPFSALPEATEDLPYNRRAGTMANPVGLSIIVPIAFVIEKISEEAVRPYEELGLPQAIRLYTDGVDAFNTGDNATAISLLSNAYEMATHASDEQLRHLIFRYLIDARARSGELADKVTFLKLLDAFADTLSDSPVQDDDCLDIVGYLYGECGNYERCLQIYERCLKSPSATREHLIELSARYCAAAQKVDRLDRAERLVIGIFKDLRQFGMRLHEFDVTTAGPFQRGAMPPRTAASIRERSFLP